MRYLAILLLILVFVSCSEKTDSTSNNTSNKKDICPLSIGNSWTYLSKFLLRNRIDTGTVSVYSKLQIGNSVWYKLNASSTGPNDATDELQSVFIGVDDDKSNIYCSNQIEGHFRGVINVSSSTSPISNSIVWMYPAKVGDKYISNWKGSTNTDGTIYMSVASINERVQTQAGEFSCYKYTLTNRVNNSPDYYAYLCPGVGIVKFEATDSTSYYELLNYQLR